MTERNRDAKRQLCGDPLRDALRAIGRWPVKRQPVPEDFTEEERFTMFKRILHENVWPVSDIVQYDGRLACSWSYSVDAWRQGGKRTFIRRVRESARSEVEEAHYGLYDLRPLECLIGSSGARFCRLLQMADVAEMEQRMRGMEADLAVIDRKLRSFARQHEAFGELRYRINLYNSSFEAVIRGGKGGWLWTTLAP